jgi:hypothetical protein
LIDYATQYIYHCRFCGVSFGGDEEFPDLSDTCGLDDIEEE